MNWEDVRRLEKMIEQANAEALSAGLEKAFAEGCDENGFWSPRRPAFVSTAKAELARIIDDVQKNRNRPEELP